MTTPTLEPLPELTPRRMQALRLTASGLTHKETARLMGCTDKMIEVYLLAVRKAWNVGSTIEAAVMAAKRGLL